MTYMSIINLFIAALICLSPAIIPLIALRKKIHLYPTAMAVCWTMFIIILFFTFFLWNISLA